MSDIIRILIGLVIAGMLWAQVRKTQAQPHRRRSFELAAGAVLALTGYNIAVAAGAPTGLLLWTLLAAALVLFASALLSLLLAWRSGEERQQHDKFQAAMHEKIEEREQVLDEGHDDTVTR